MVQAGRDGRTAVCNSTSKLTGRIQKRNKTQLPFKIYELHEGGAEIEGHKGIKFTVTT